MRMAAAVIVLVLVGQAAAAISPPIPPPTAAVGQLWVEGDVGIGQTFRLRLDVSGIHNITDFRVDPVIFGPLRITPANQTIDVIAGETTTLWWNGTPGIGFWSLHFEPNFDENFQRGSLTQRLYGHAFEHGAWVAGDNRGTPTTDLELSATHGWHGWNRDNSVRHNTTIEFNETGALIRTLATTDAAWKDHVHWSIRIGVDRVCYPEISYHKCPPPRTPPIYTQYDGNTTSPLLAAQFVPVPRNETGSVNESRQIVIEIYANTQNVPAPIRDCYFGTELAWHGETLVARIPERPGNWHSLPERCDTQSSNMSTLKWQTTPYGKQPGTYPVGYGYPMVGSDWAPERVEAAANGSLWWMVGDLDPTPPAARDMPLGPEPAPLYDDGKYTPAMALAPVLATLFLAACLRRRQA